MDPFNDDFDAKAALLSMDDEGEVPCSSLDAYENEFKNENPEYLKVVEKVEAEKIANANKSKLPNAKERMRRLETICVDGVKPLDVKPKKDIKRYTIYTQMNLMHTISERLNMLTRVPDVGLLAIPVVFMIAWRNG